MAQTRLPFCSPYRLFIAPLVEPRSNADEIHRAYALFAWRTMALRHVLIVGALTFLWPVLFVIMAMLFTCRIGPTVAERTGKSLIRQLAEQLWLAAAYSIPPDKYFVFELFRDDRRAQANDYVLRFELKGGFHNLMHVRAKIDPDYGNTKSGLTDKLLFSRRCREAGIDAPIVYCYLERDPTSKKWRLIAESHTGLGLPACDLFLKPSHGKGGWGCERWQFVGTGYRGPDGGVVDEKELLRHVAGLAEHYGRYLIQECLQNHPDLSDLSGGLTSLRVTSCRNEQALFEATNATLKVSYGTRSSVDNFHQGGGVAMVDMYSGRVGPASDSWKDRPCVWHKVHPVSGGAIEGRRLPLWKQTVAMVERTHALFPDRTMLGFDVAITDRGPVVIEGNVQSGCDMIQRTHDRPVGKQRLGQLLAFHANTAIRLPLPVKPMKWFGPLDYFRPR